jgi:predicted metal-dependent phosphoesterase TrpH
MKLPIHLNVEFHCHTSASKDSLTSPAKLLSQAIKHGVDRLIITDHNSISGGRQAWTINPELVIVGEEIMTTKGEILAAYVQEEIPAGLPPLKVIGLLRDQAAFISVSHPFDTIRSGGWEETDLLEIRPLVDAIEVYNSRCMNPRFNRQAKEFAEKYDIPGTVGSDAHAAFEVGRSILRLAPFQDAEGLRRVVRSGVPITRWSPPWIHLTSRYATVTKKLHTRT